MKLKKYCMFYIVLHYIPSYLIFVPNLPKVPIIVSYFHVQGVPQKNVLLRFFSPHRRFQTATWG